MTNKDLFGNNISENIALKYRYGEVPVSVLDTMSSRWIARKRKWINLGIESERGRPGKALGFSKTCNSVQGGADSHKNISVFDATLTELMYRWFCPSGGTILDPFAGGSVRGIVANYLGYHYTGIELREEQVLSNIEQGQKILPGNEPEWICGDSNEVLNDFDRQFDFIFSCPPYFNLEVYSDDVRDLSNMDYKNFYITYCDIIRKSVTLLRSGGYACFVVSEVRDKNGYYVGLVPGTIAAFINNGLKYYNEIILKNNIGSAAIRIPRIFDASRKIVRIHQNVLIFKK